MVECVTLEAGGVVLLMFILFIMQAARPTCEPIADVLGEIAKEICVMRLTTIPHP